jgi:hypothetical protein
MRQTARVLGARFDAPRNAIVLSVDIEGRQAECNLTMDNFSFRPGMNKVEEMQKTAALFNERRGREIQLEDER